MANYEDYIKMADDYERQARKIDKKIHPMKNGGKNVKAENMLYSNARINHLESLHSELLSTAKSLREKAERINQSKNDNKN